MLRCALALAGVLVCFAVTGCTMCCHPYDNCGPVYESGCSTCSHHGRVNSVLEGGGRELVPQPAPQQMPTPAVRPKPAASATTSAVTRRQRATSPQLPQGQTVRFSAEGGRVTGKVQGQIKTGDVPGSERIVSITERIVGEPATTAGTSPAPAIVAEEDPATSAGAASRIATQLPSSGWTARRPSSSEVIR